MSDEKLSEQIKDYQQLGRENPNVDVSLLMMNALENESKNINPSKSYKWAYTIALGVPPFGLFFAAKYYFNGDEQDRQAAKICVLLTVVALFLIYIFGKLLLSGSGTSVSQIEQIKPSDIQQVLQ